MRSKFSFWVFDKFLKKNPGNFLFLTSTNITVKKTQMDGEFLFQLQTEHCHENHTYDKFSLHFLLLSIDLLRD